jgi:hypothetical protein
MLELRSTTTTRSRPPSGPEAIPPAAPSTVGTPAPTSIRWISIAVVVGILFRVLQYLGNRSLWLDEALLAPSILTHSFGELFDPFAANPTPFGFLILVKLTVTAVGESELALRLVPLAAGIASVLLFASVARRLLPDAAAVVSTSLFGVSPFLIYYSSELKHYSSDVAAATLILLLGARLQVGVRDWREWTAWGAAALVAVAVSRTSVFLVGAVALILVATAFRNRTWRAASGIAATTVPAAFLAVFPFLRRSPAGSSASTAEPSYMDSFWSSGFMPLPPRSGADWMWFPQTAARVFQDPLGLIQNTNEILGWSVAAFGIFAFVAGVVWLSANRPAVLAMAALPIVLALLASGLRLYPFGANWNTGGRVILYLVPGFLLIIGAGAGFLANLLAARHRALGLALIALLVAPPLVQAATTVPYGRGELKPLLAFVETHWEEGDRLYVHYDAVPAFRYYATRYGLTERDHVEGVCARFEPERYLEALNDHRGQERLWVLFTAGLGAELFDERALMVDYLDHVGTRLDDRVARGTSLYLFDLATPSSDEPFAVRLPRLRDRIEGGCHLWE